MYDIHNCMYDKGENQRNERKDSEWQKVREWINEWGEKEHSWKRYGVHNWICFQGTWF